jgi:prepilin-type N-terminal cleavage/methylation domain-containing protein
MNTQHLSREKGFTLVEIILALLIGLLLLATVYFAVTTAQRSTTGVQIKVVAQQDVRAILEAMALEIAMASYNPTFNPTLWRDPSNCTNLVPASSSPAPNQDCRGIQLATANSLSIEMDLDGNSQIYQPGSPADQNEIITYVYDMPNQRITRQVNCGEVISFLGDLAGSAKSVRVVNDVNHNSSYDQGSDIPVFRYFDVTNAEILEASLPEKIPLIRRIDISLSVETEEVDPNTRARRRMTYITSVVPRNHAYR